jgi:arylsulfatase A-like enzyme
VDIYPTVLAAIGRPLPQTPLGRPLHGVNLLPTIENPAARTRDFAVCGQFGHSVSITDGEWILHQAPVAGNQPLFWHGYSLAKFLPYPLGAFDAGRRPVIDYMPWPTPTWLSDKRSDPNELVNLAEREPARLREMQSALRETLIRLQAPPEQIERLGLG